MSKKQHKSFYCCYLIAIALLWWLFDFLQVDIESSFLSGFLEIVLQLQVALIALAFVVQVPRLKIFENDPATQDEIKNQWRKFLQRFVSFVVFLLVSLIILEFFSHQQLNNLIAATTTVGLFYLFKSIFSFIKHI